MLLPSGSESPHLYTTPAVRPVVGANGTGITGRPELLFSLHGEILVLHHFHDFAACALARGASCVDAKKRVFRASRKSIENDGFSRCESRVKIAKRAVFTAETQFGKIAFFRKRDGRSQTRSYRLDVQRI